MKEPTQQYSDTIKSLQSRIQALEDENRLLKERLEEAGVSYANIVSGDAEGVVELYDPDQGARIKKFDVTDKIASDFFMMFCRGRKDVYDLRYTNPKTGKNGYYSQCFNRWDRGCHIQKKDGVRCKDCELRAYKPVTLPLIKAHMNGTDPNGNDVVAIYPMLENNLCQLLVFDFDNHAKGAEQEDYANIDDGWKEEINALRRICKNLDVDAVVERSRSGRGAHLWIFFKEMVPARLARRFGFALLEKGAESVNLKSFKYYDRMIPTQDALPEGGLGNVIALPLQGMALKSGNSAFIDENWNAYEDQLNVLAGTRRLTRQGIEDYLSLWYSTGSISEDKANAIYDIENYAETYWKDLEEANSAVVVSSPRLNNQKVDRIIKILGKRRELGVKVTIVTWHPDAYKYGKDDVRMELMERLRKAGFEIRLVEESCEHYAVIDNEIVWYGSVNLLSKEDAEDNLMRVCSKDIAAELLEMTFGSEIELQEW